MQYREIQDKVEPLDRQPKLLHPRTKPGRSPIVAVCSDQSPSKIGRTQARKVALEARVVERHKQRLQRHRRRMGMTSVMRVSVFVWH